jgi:hypothetical protein
MGFGTVIGNTYVNYNGQPVDVFELDKSRRYNLRLPDSDELLARDVEGGKVFGSMVDLSRELTSCRNILCNGSVVVEDSDSRGEQ